MTCSAASSLAGLHQPRRRLQHPPLLPRFVGPLVDGRARLLGVSGGEQRFGLLPQFLLGRPPPPAFGEGLLDRCGLVGGARLAERGDQLPRHDRLEERLAGLARRLVGLRRDLPDGVAQRRGGGPRKQPGLEIEAVVGRAVFIFSSCRR